MKTVRGRKWLLAIGLLLLGFMAGGLAFAAYRQTPGYIPPLKVLGDVARVVKLEDPQQLGKLHAITYKGHKYQAIKLMDIIDAAQPIASPEQIYLAGNDGFVSALPAQGLDKSYITFTAQYGWEAINLNHPLNSNAKMLKEIIVVADGSSPGFGLTIINPDHELLRVTPGQLHSRTLMEYLYAEGQASVKNGGKSYVSSVYTRRKVFQLSDLLPIRKGGMMLLMSADGKQHFLENRGYWELKDNYISYLQPEEHSSIDKVKGVIIDPPAASIMDIYYDTRHYLENGDKVLLVVLAGFNFSQYSYAIENGYASFLKKMTPAMKASGVYPLASKVWLASMLSGTAPQENGVVSEKDWDLKVPSLFALARELGKPALLLQSAPKMLNTEVEPLLAIDKNSSGTADDELYAMSLSKLKEGELIVLYFDGIARSSDDYGQEAESTRAAITAADQYLQELANNWPGKIIMTGIPGKSPQQIFSGDSIFVPYLCLK